MKMKSNSWSASLIAAASLLDGGPMTAVGAFSAASPTTTAIHSIDDVPFREVDIRIRSLDESITILEATAEGQDQLVDAVLLMDDLDDEDRGDGVGRSNIREDPYGAVLWPAASAVSEYVTRDSFWNDDGQRRSRRPTVLELGTGTGLVALSASASNKYSSVLATDYEALPLRLLDAAYRLNRERRDGDEDGGAMTPIVASLLDICDFSVPLPPADLVCAADVLYEAKTGVAMARRAVEALERGSRVVVGCSPGRPGRPAFLEELRRLRPDVRGADFVEVEGTTCSGRRNSLICGEGSTSISDEPKMLLVALMDLTPDCLNETAIFEGV